MIIVTDCTCGAEPETPTQVGDKNIWMCKKCKHDAKTIALDLASLIGTSNVTIKEVLLS
jgi:ribosomal protein L37AE/L43A